MKNVLFASTKLLPVRWWETTVRGRWSGPRENALDGKVLEEIALDSRNPNTLLAVTWFWWSTKFRWKKESNKQLRQRHYLCWTLTAGVQSTESMSIRHQRSQKNNNKGWTHFFWHFSVRCLHLSPLWTRAPDKNPCWFPSWSWLSNHKQSQTSAR